MNSCRYSTSASQKALRGPKGAAQLSTRSRAAPSRSVKRITKSPSDCILNLLIVDNDIEDFILK